VPENKRNSLLQKTLPGRSSPEIPPVFNFQIHLLHRLNPHLQLMVKKMTIGECR